MPKYVIEREIPGIGNVSNQDLVAISQKSCGVLSQLGRRSSGFTATSWMTKFTASLMRPAKNWSGSMLRWVDPL